MSRKTFTRTIRIVCRSVSAPVGSLPLAVTAMGDFEGEQQEEVSINAEKIAEEVNSLIRQKLQPEKWVPKKVDGWTKDLIEATLKLLAETKKPFKYIVTCVIQQRTGAGLTSAYSALWDTSRDGAFAADFENDHLQCSISLYWVKLD
jgi:dynein light chain Tctex-type 1